MKTAALRAILCGVRANLSDLDTRVEAISAAGLLSLRNIAVNHPKNLRIIERENGIPFIVTALRNFAESQQVQEGAMGLLRALVKTSDTVCMSVLCLCW